MQKYYQNYHKHTSYSHIYPKFKDSVVTVEDYLNAMLPLAQKGYPQIYSTLEHGYQGVWTHCLNTIEHFNDEHKNDTENYEPIRFVYGIEGYFVENHADKDDTNNHIVLLAKNINGMKALNKANAKTFISNETIESGNAKLFFNYNGTEPYFYKRNRYDLELLLSLPSEDVMVTTACVGFWGYSVADNRLVDTTKTDEIILKLHNHFKNNFFLEVQANKSQLQKEINLHILELSKKYGIEIISATDSHGITNENLIEKKELIKSTNKGKLFYDNGDDFYEDFPSVEELYRRFKKQGILSDADIERAIANTNKILDFEKIEIDRSLKVPSIKELKGKSQIEKNQFLQNIINKEYKRQYDDMNHDKKDEYLEAIKYEFSEIEKCNMADYFIDDYYIVQKGLANGGIITDTGRGSAPSFYINKLLGLTKVDRINSVVKLYPERFMTATRILDSKTPPDIDNNVANREPFIKAQRELMGNLSSFDLIAVGKLKLKSAFKMLARAKDINPQLANKITKQIDSYELAKKHSESEVDITKFVDGEYLSLLKECDKYLGIVDSFSPHPCACSLYDGDMIADYGVIRLKSTQKGSKENFCCLLESSTMDSYGIVKNDWLVADSIALIQEIYDEIGIERPTINKLLGLIEHDEKTWNIYAKGITNTVNQVEQVGTRKKAELFKPKNIYELTQFVAGVRPSFKSMLKIFLNREHFDYNIPSLDKLLQDKYCDSSFILYQEQIMSVLAFADFEMAETYTIIKAISKKKDYVINGAKERFIPNFAKKCLASKDVETLADGMKVAQQVWTIIENSASYGFNCLSGDTKLYRQKNNTQFSPTIAEMYRIKNDKKYAKKTGHYSLHQKYNSQGYGKVLSLKDNRLYENQIIDIYKKGIKMTYEIITDDGSKIYVTLDHKFPTVQGDKTVKQLKVGDVLYKLDRYEKNKNVYTLTKNGSQNFKKGHCGFIKLENSATNNYRSFRDDCVNERKSCTDCGTEFSEDLRFEVHHIDFNRKNNNVMNYAWLCSSCHKKRHYSHGRVKKFEKGLLTKLVKIISIKPYKEEEVYDVSVSENVSHTFTLDNGIVTHNCSHAYSYALDSVHLAYLKANYPYEFYKVCLQHYTDKNNKDKVIALTKEMKDFYGISLANMTFGEDNRKFAINRREHEILQTMKSLKGIQENSPSVLYELGKNKYDNFLDLWLDMKQQGLNKTTMETLASLNYFKPFGTEIDILNYYKLFDLFKGSGKSLFKKTFKKDNEQFQPMFKYMKPFVTKETKANYICDGTQHDMIIELCKHLKHIQTPPILKWLWETRYLGNTDITIPSDDLYYITSIEKTSFGTTFFDLIKLSTNESVTYKVDKKYFETFPIESDVIINANIIYKDKWKKVNDKFVKTGKQEQVIKSYRYKCGKNNKKC